MKEGFTTGSCAAAAALACCLWMRDGECPPRVCLRVPEGREYAPQIIAHEDGSCGAIKDSGDDPDITGGMEIIAKVELLEGRGDVVFAAGEGVGMVTEPGLKVPPGEPAINPVPRCMIREAVRSVFGMQAAKVTISIPGGEETAKKTFNPRLGIVGGLSILGTSGIVRPMSDEALKDSMLEELKMRRAQGHVGLIFSFGNQGEAAMKALFADRPIVQVSNEIGFMLDSALELGFERVIIGGHPGKLSKISAGIMQTHSRTADGRREAIITQLALMGAPLSLIQGVYGCKTTDAAMQLIAGAGFGGVWDKMAQAAAEYAALRVRREMQIGVVYVDNQGKILGRHMEEGQW